MNFYSVLVLFTECHGAPCFNGQINWHAYVVDLVLTTPLEYKQYYKQHINHLRW